MITQATWDRIEAAIAAAPVVEGEVPLSRVLYPLCESRAEYEALAEEKRRDIVTYEHHAEGLGGATGEMQQNAKAELPVLRATRSMALLVLSVLAVVDAEPPQLDAVGALMVGTMLADLDELTALAATVAPVPVPPAVEQLVYRSLPESTLTAMFDLVDAKRELGRFRLPLSVEAEGDRETVLAACAAADKTLCSVPCWITAATGSLA